MTELVLRNLSVTLGQNKVVDDVSFTAQDGIMLGLIGPNGAGKTSLLRAIAGLLPYQGDVTLDGNAFASLGRKHMAQKISYLAQDKIAHWPLPVADLVMLGRLPHLSTFQQPGVDDRAAVARALGRTDMAALSDRNILELSGGEQARAFLARALAVEAPILLADEPIAALDPAHQLEIMGQLRHYAEQGALVIVVMHDLTLAGRFCHRLALMNEGKLAMEGPPNMVLTDALLEGVYGISVSRGRAGDGDFVIPWSRL
jgi:iron complex transport system ATP-binding protein